MLFGNVINALQNSIKFTQLAKSREKQISQLSRRSLKLFQNVLSQTTFPFEDVDPKAALILSSDVPNKQKRSFSPSQIRHLLNKLSRIIKEGEFSEIFLSYSKEL